MKKQSTPARLLRLLFSGLCALLIMSCEPDDAVAPSAIQDMEAPGKAHQLSKTNTYYGPAQPIGGGVMQAMVTMTHAGEPVAVGVRISEKGLTKLPQEHFEYTLRMPNKAAMLPFDHIDVGWGPEGHEPPGIYDLPHFDIHFYMISQEEKMNILDPEKAEILPPREYWPKHYFPTPGYVPRMGKHWLNELTPELRGETFTHTFIYGSYDGEFIFYEPMITLDYLLQQNSEEFEIFQPAAFQRTGLYYPTRYSIRYDEKKKEYLIVLDGMVKR